MNKKTQYIDLGHIDYQKAWDYQTQLFEQTVALKVENRKRHPADQELTPNYLLFCSHPHVYTLGKSGNAQHLLLNQAALEEKQAAFYNINRGGDITYHGPGQLVVYLILDLDNFFTDIHQYLRYLEEAVIRTLGDYGIQGTRVKGLTGVWIGDKDPHKARKICALGVKSSRWVTMHGFAFNLSTDLNYFKHIIPCGIQDKAVTSLEKEMGAKPSFQAVKMKLKNHLVRLFGFDLAEAHA